MGIEIYLGHEERGSQLLLVSRGCTVHNRDNGASAPSIILSRKVDCFSETCLRGKA